MKKTVFTIILSALLLSGCEKTEIKLSDKNINDLASVNVIVNSDDAVFPEEFTQFLHMDLQSYKATYLEIENIGDEELKVLGMYEIDGTYIIPNYIDADLTRESEGTVMGYNFRNLSSGEKASIIYFTFYPEQYRDMNKPFYLSLSGEVFAIPDKK